mmetsp:Transcript_30722/g.75375  ORF Transcript_30722/g.75375 Transcript_30722/m.75375 type:complete len:685 (-) Transcript_30722:473-2527(-)|eukprot:CAMPEP_0206263166 /NCGR_PEP_ID=MMETSP0047_2-20121206/28666_1 /ASSEMBLY_ACC=CAM_ASM_000192 /TAXON_ID=195065 /ORGANISM="Chroomonas mesostigmatica_cf, Strain CCMP1168" /LENGTH=684 /DNA_ID=CAMNT_0053690675 /DNA_START=228 /DNA_END=2282 /DNA_ORIENTATION=-
MSRISGFRSLFDARDLLESPLSLVRNGQNEFGVFIQLFFDNLSSMIGLLGAMMATFGSGPGGFGVPSDVLAHKVYSKSASGLGLAMLFGNVYYSWQASRMARLSGRPYTAQPYGVHTIAAFAFVYGIMVPVYLNEWAKTGFSDLPEDKAACFSSAYAVAVAANFTVGLLQVGLAAFGPALIRIVPPAALLVPIAGIGLTFLGLDFMVGNFAQPIVGFLPLLFLWVGWHAGVKVLSVIPPPFTVMAVGTVLAWIDPVTRGVGGAGGFGLALKAENAAAVVRTFVPEPQSFYDIELGYQLLGSYIGIVIPLGFSATALTLMCLLSARQAGDPYPIRETMVADGVGTMVAACFGSPFGTVVYIGHPSHKKNGATVGYSWINGFAFLILGMSGIFAIFEAIFPIQAVGPIILFIGLLICEDAVRALPSKHLSVFFFGLLPSICAWLTNVVPIGAIQSEAQWGVFALKHGYMLISFFWCGILSYVVDRQWLKAALWCGLATLFALFGIIHMGAAGTDALANRLGTTGPFVPEAGGDQPCTYERPADGEESVWPNNPEECGALQFRFTIAYVMMGVVCLALEALQRMGLSAKPDVAEEVYGFQKDWYNIEQLTHTHAVAAHGAEDSQAPSSGSGATHKPTADHSSLQMLTPSAVPFQTMGVRLAAPYYPSTPPMHQLHGQLAYPFYNHNG